MLKFLLVALSFTITVTVQAQQEMQKDSVPPNGWDTEGNVQLLFNQSAFNAEWTGGGTSSIAGNLTVDYNINYRQDSFTWRNKILGNYGLTKVRTDEFPRKSSDRLDINSLAGLEIEESGFYYSFFLNFRTQFDKGYRFSEDADGETIRTETTHFLSPAYLQAGPGIMYKKNENFVINLAPATSRFIFVDDRFTTGPDYQDGEYFGVDRGKSMRFEFGSSLNILANFELLENVIMSNSVNFYQNYLDKPGNIDIDYLMDLQMDINDYLSANLLFQAIYDDNAVAAFQIREVFGVGINYGF
ncbi:DUF3078 domain-containing protein [Zunongwangia sp. F260]|uniref:DUF3078 domain-containing protein n=1 Tax=Autumnicola lenta TaxID=3075593 RepID=A0ABU3CH24_9FLAO|nr:DUF3078 domain-containing protein [Zunongwangia sp. F260]MDT0645652.1 DUF3078 domain-containing protein [Zunongwangia sp. F260]